MASSGNPQPSTTPVPKKGFMGMRLSWKHLAIIAAAFVGAGVVGLAVNADAIFASSGQRFNDAVYSATQQTRDARSNLEAISADMTVIHDTSSVVESAAPTQRQPLQTAGGSISNPAAPATQNARRAGSAANGNVPVRSYSDSAETVDAAAAASDNAQEPGGPDDANGDPAKVETEPETIQERAAKLTGDKRSENQRAAQRLVDNWQPRYEAAKVGHVSLERRVADTREFWNAYFTEQMELIESLDPNIPSHWRWREQTLLALHEDQQRWLRWDEQAQSMLGSSRDAMAQLEGMNIAIAFYRNRADFAAVTSEVLEVAPTVSLLVNDLSAFEKQTERLALAISDAGPAR